MVAESSKAIEFQRENVALLKSGELSKVATAIERLEAKDETSGLSVGEQRMLYRALQILKSEAGWRLTEADLRLRGRGDEGNTGEDG